MSEHRRELATLRQEIQRCDRLLGLLRTELRSARERRGRPTPEAASSPLARVRSAVGSGWAKLAEWLRRRDAEYALKHGRPSRFGQILRGLRGMRRSSRAARRPSFVTDRSGDDALLGPTTTPDGPAPPLERQLAEARRALAQRRALEALIRAELERQRGLLPSVSDRDIDETSSPALDPETLVPNAAMAAAMAGRVRPVDNGATGTQASRADTARPSVTVAVRFHDTTEIPSLERCLYSLQAQTGVDLTALIMFQGTDEQALAVVRRSLERVWLSQPLPRLVGVPNPDHADLRTTMLNRALDLHYEETSNDFFYVLDHDDVVFSHALATMAGPVVGSAAAVSFGKVLVARYLSLDGYDVLYRMDDHFKAAERDISEITIDNFCPFHSYVYHTRAMSPVRLQFNESMDRLEDYETLLRVATTYPVYTGAIESLVGLYCWKGARAVAGPIEGSAAGERSAWERNRELLAETIREVAAQSAGRV